MNIIDLEIPGLKLIEPKVFGDHRGFFYETYSARRYKEAGIATDFVQDNLSFSKRGILRGLHFQNPHSQGKLVSVFRGEVFDVAVDLRLNSPTYGKWHSIILNEENKRQFWIPSGFAHGFCVTSEEALFCYKCDAYYSPQDEITLQWNDSDLSIPWPIESPLLSSKDQSGIAFRQIPRDRLLSFAPS